MGLTRVEMPPAPRVCYRGYQCCTQADFILAMCSAVLQACLLFLKRFGGTRDVLYVLIDAYFN